MKLLMSDIDYLVLFWETVREYIPLKDRQSAADHVVNELVDLGITDDDLKSLAVDKLMLNSIKEHIDLDDEELEE
jgi:hypothetical protein